MHILIANHRLDEPAGTETYVVTLAGRLVAAGHRVTCFSPHLGETASLLRSLGVATVDDARDASEPDVLHRASHLDAGHLAMAAWPTTATVFVVHGNGTMVVVERPQVWRDRGPGLGRRLRARRRRHGGPGWIDRREIQGCRISSI